MAGPLVIAHRGDSHSEAEHTRGAFLAALAGGADGLECDVRLTADGHLVCVHDRDLRRTALRGGVVSAMTLDELDRVDVSAWRTQWRELDDEAEERDPRLGRLMTLRELLELVDRQPGRIELSIETKHPTRYAGLVERRLVELLAEFGWSSADSPVRILSFSWVALARVRVLAPRLPVVFCMERRRTWALAQTMAEGDWIAAPGLALLRRDPSLRQAISSGRKQAHVWTVNEVEDFDWCSGLGVDAVITDKPGTMVAHRDNTTR